MALMTEERRKEMEEEMSRFELEISAPGGAKSAMNLNDSGTGSKPLSPPPPPPAVGVLIPEVLAKVPPPPPPSSSPIQAILKAPPPPPPPPTIQSRPQQETIRFIPHQLQRHPARPPMRHGGFIPVRGPPMPMGGPPGPFSSGPHIGPYIPPVHQGPPMVHGPMHMPPGAMPMPHQMGMMPPGFCPHGGPGMGPGNHPCDQPQAFMHGGMMQSFEASVPNPTSSESSVVAAPAVYAAPFVKSHAENSSNHSTSANGQEPNTTSSSSVATPSKSEKVNFKYDDQQVAVGPVVPPTASEETTVVSKKKEKKKKTVRMAGGQAWEDSSLLDWDTDDFRIFCGDLGNDVTDEVLIRAFSKYTSFVKAKVIRDKRTNKTKGYGFVSFKDPQDFIKAMREMNGKYVGSRPIKLRKSTWRDRNIDIVKKKQREKEKLGLL